MQGLRSMVLPVSPSLDSGATTLQLNCNQTFKKQEHLLLLGTFTRDVRVKLVCIPQ